MKAKKEEATSNEPKFIVVEEDTTYMRKVKYPDPEGIIWGMVIIFSGLLLFLNVFNLLSWEIWSYLLRFWPILIIIAGFQIILGTHIISRILISLITFMLFAWVILISVYEIQPNLLNSLPEQFVYPIEWWEVIQQ